MSQRYVRDIIISESAKLERKTDFVITFAFRIHSVRTRHTNEMFKIECYSSNIHQQSIFHLTQPSKGSVLKVRRDERKQSSFRYSSGNGNYVELRPIHT